MKRSDFNRAWQFAKKGDQPIPVQLPHDAMIHSPRRRGAPSGSAQGFFLGGEYVYQKTFILTEEQVQGHIVFQFEGVYKNAKVYLILNFN